MDSFALIIFGITGNLAQIKLIPALYDMEEKNLLPENMTIIGIARKPMSKEEIKAYLHKVLHLENRHHQHDINKEVFEKLLSRLHYLNGDLDNPDFYNELKQYLENLNAQGVKCKNRIFYLATYPNLYAEVFNNLQKADLNQEDSGWVRLMIEKPIGNDLASAQELNKLLLKYFNEGQIFRLDHYLGKETLQNILAFRFSNNVFEPMIKKDYIDHIQITAAEDFGIGRRGGYYDTVGALKDVGQNHILQMIAFVTMDAPKNFNNKDITEQRIKILQELIPVPEKIIFGQYAGYTQEANIKPESTTDTFFAFKTKLNSERFNGIPIYVRGGKKLNRTVTEISVVFKKPINQLYKDHDQEMESNALIYRIQPNEGIVLKVLIKEPGHQTELEPTYMQFCYPQDIPHYLPDPYERLISDAIRGDQTFFNDAEEIEAEWKFTDALVKTPKKPVIYAQGSWGPAEANQLIEQDGRKWLEPSIDFCTID